MVETKEISELTRSNRIAMLSHISTVTVMVFFMIWESVRGQLSPVYMTIATVVGVIPLIGEVICWKGNTEHAMIKHLVSYGFALFYTICLFTSPTNLIYVFVIPMIFVVTIYSDTRYLLLINTGTILESIIVVVIGATKGRFWVSWNRSSSCTDCCYDYGWSEFCFDLQSDSTKTQERDLQKWRRTKQRTKIF